MGCGGAGGSGGAGGGGQSTGLVLSSLSTTSIGVGSASFSFAAYGTGVLSGSVVEWNGAALNTTYVSATQLSAQLPASDMTVSGSVPVTVFTPGTGGETSNAVTFTLTNPNAILTSISPSAGTVGGAAFTLTATGSGFVTNSQIAWNGGVLPTNYVSATQLTAQVPAGDLATMESVSVSVVNPAPGGGKSTNQYFYVSSSGTTLSVVPVYASDIAWDATHGLFYASLSSTNSVVSINPVNGTIVTTQAAGSGPNLLSISSDDSYLWVGEDGSGLTRRFNLPSLAPDSTISLPAAVSLEGAPDSPHTVAITDTRGNVTVYDDDTARPWVSGSGFSLQWGADSTKLYGVWGNTDPSDSVAMTVSSSGVTGLKGNGFVFASYFGLAHYDKQTGYLYADNGQVSNPDTGELVGSFNLSGYSSAPVAPECVPDGTQGVVYCIGYLAFPTGLGNYSYTIDAFDQKTYRLLRTLPLPGLAGLPGKFIRWGNAGLAFATTPYPYPTTGNPGSIYLIDGSFVNGTLPADTSRGVPLQQVPVVTSMSPQSANVGSANLTITVSGGNFWNDSVVSLDGTALNTVFVSASQLQATIPSLDLDSAGVHSITVSNGISTNVGISSLAFTVVPAGSGLTALNLVALDVAWEKNSGLLYAAVSSSDAQYPNSVVAVDPNSGQVVKSQYVASDPSLVRVSGDGSYVYSASSTEGRVTQMQLPGLSSPLSWGLGNSVSAGYGGSEYTVDLQVAPGAPQTTAVSKAQSYVTISDGVTIYDNGATRSVSFQPQGSEEILNLQWGPTSSTLYAASYSGVSDVDNLSVNPLGVTLTRDVPYAFQMTTYPPVRLQYDTDAKIHFDAGIGNLYDDDGQVVNPATGTQVGTYGASGLVAPDSSLNRVFIIGQTLADHIGSFTIQSFNQTNFSLVNSISLSGIIGEPMALVRWGANGLALATYSYQEGNSGQLPGMLYILNDTNFVSANIRPAGQSKPETGLVQRTWSRPQLTVKARGALNGRGQLKQIPKSAAVMPAH